MHQSMTGNVLLLTTGHVRGFEKHSEKQAANKEAGQAMAMTRPNLDELKTLAKTNRDNPKFSEGYATALLQDGKLILARQIIQKLHGRLQMANREDDANRLVTTHGGWVAGEEGGLHSAWGRGSFLPLEKEVKQSFFNRRRRNVCEGEVLFRTGDIADKIYLILEGELAISITNALTGPILVNFVRPGDLIGESALQPGLTRTADVFANKDSTLLEFDRKELEKALSMHPDLRDLLEEEASLRRKIIVLSHCQPFSLLTLSERIIVAEQSIEKRIPEGSTIKEEDAHLSFTALVISGEIESYFTADMRPHYSGSLYSNSLFGLSKLYFDDSVPGKLVAKNDVSLLMIPHSVIEDASQAHSNFERSVAEIAKMNFSRATETIRMLSSTL